MPNENLIPHGDENRISEVSVFTHRAQIRRQASVSVGTGQERLLIEAQAHHVDRDTLAASVFGEGQLLGVQYQEVPVQDAPQQEIRALDERKRELRRERQKLLNAIEGVEKQKQFLDSTLSYADAQVPREIKTRFPDVQQLGSMLDFMDERYATLSTRREQLERQLQELDYELSVVERKLKESRSGRDAVIKAIEVMFDSAREQTLRVEIDYGVQRAAWSPQYKVEVDEELSTVQLSQFARISQNSGESWDGVHLTVSNATPTAGNTLPKPLAWRLRQRVEQVMPRAAMASMPMAGGAMDGAVAEAEAEFEALDDMLSCEGVEEPIPAVFAQAEKQETAIAFEYRLPKRVDIPSGVDESLLPLSSRILQGDFYHHVVPRLDPHCYLVCRLSGDRELLPGPINVHFAGRYVASTRIREDEAGEPLLLNLGVDRTVLVKRESLTDKKAETFFGRVERGHVAQELEYRIVLENRRTQPVRIELFDNLPHATSDRYQVKGLSLSPEPTDRDWQDRPGLMRWVLNLGAGKTREIQLGFSVKYPRGDRPEGL